MVAAAAAVPGVLNNIAEIDPPYLPDLPITYKKPRAESGSR